MEDERDDRRTDTVEDGGGWPETHEMNVQSRQRRDEDEVGKNERPAACPGAPEATAQIPDVHPDLNRERSGHRLAHRNGLAHPLLGQPAALGDELALHLTDKR